MKCFEHYTPYMKYSKESYYSFDLYKDIIFQKIAYFWNNKDTLNEAYISETEEGHTIEVFSNVHIQKAFKRRRKD